MPDAARRTRETPRGTRIAHIGIAVRSLTEAVPFYQNVLGLAPRDLDDADGARIAGFAADESLVELLEAVELDSPIGRYINKRGPGIHHVCFAVDDLDATLQRCRDAGLKLIDEAPRVGAERAARRTMRTMDSVRIRPTRWC